ncbi:hypothetical protein Ferp_0209 [Ferroglobus placidus DSM 10642]|uniref:Uncharacterized protein n=1 Tax=Ferroglobus placidus (strain DSM 10642 / AEDII12DO) TaxID=589924 RepID=D3S1T7_FERPA|nr:hypothetical protein Ferp_0209 [Ferroglobus placidus DSM 10642]
MKISRISVFLVFAVLTLSSVANAKYDPPGPPAVEVRVWLVNFTPLENFDDGANGKSDILFEGSADVKKGGKSYKLYFEYDYDSVSGAIVPKNSKGKEVMYLLYSERECWPVNLEVEVKATDVDSPPIDPNDFLGSAKFKVDPQLKKEHYSITIPGKFLVNVYVEAVPVRDDADKCSYFFDQPETMSSSIVTKSGTNIYDFELANMLDMWIGEKGYANMLVVFQQCFGGGMADDILDKLDGDIAILSASKHDEPAYGYKNAESMEKQKTNPYTREVLKGLKEDKKAEDVGKSAEKKDEFSAYGAKRYYEGATSVRKNVEHPQYVSKGKGNAISLGKRADGSEVKSKHAIVFGGNNNKMRHWKNIEEFVGLLLKSKGFSDEDIVVLADSGKNSGKAYVDGPGTKQALWNAIKDLSAKMNKDEQLVIYVTDHGNLETADKAVRKVINDPVRQPIPPRNNELKDGALWLLNESFLNLLNITDDNDPYLALMVSLQDGTEDINEISEFLSNVIVYLNGKALKANEIEPVYALDNKPDLDAYEVTFPIYNESLLKEKNLIELEFVEPEVFEPFLVEVVVISTGAMPDLVFEELNESDVAPLPQKTTFVVDLDTVVSTDRIELNESEMDELLGNELFELIVEKKEWYNNNTHLVPDILKSWFGNEKINVEIEMKDGGAMDIYLVLENAYVTELEKGKLSDATAKAKLREDTARRILNSDDPVKEIQDAYGSGEIRYEGVGLMKSLQVEFTKVIVRIYFVITDLLG